MANIPARRAAVSLSLENLTRYFRFEGQTLPLVIEPSQPGLDAVAWAEHRAAHLDALISDNGAVLLRNFPIDSTACFQQVITAACGPLMDYIERSSPRTCVSGKVFTSTDYAAERSIFLHNEQSYNLVFPLRIAFYCEQPAQSGGATPIADTRKVLNRLCPETRGRFQRTGYLLARNYGRGCGLPWQNAFQTDDPEKVKEHCQANEIDFEWRGDELRTRQVRPVIARHPRTGALAWFNHLTFFHKSALEPEVQRELEAHFTEDTLPNHTYYGDGAPVEDHVMQELRDAYIAEQVSFTWQKGDVLLLDNLLVAHGRAPFEGPRKVRVAMAQPWNWADVRLRDISELSQLTGAEQLVVIPKRT